MRSGRTADNCGRKETKKRKQSALVAKCVRVESCVIRLFGRTAGRSERLKNVMRRNHRGNYQKTAAATTAFCKKQLFRSETAIDPAAQCAGRRFAKRAYTRARQKTSSDEIGRPYSISYQDHARCRKKHRARAYCDIEGARRMTSSDVLEHARPMFLRAKPLQRHFACKESATRKPKTLLRLPSASPLRFAARPLICE